VTFCGEAQRPEFRPQRLDDADRGLLENISLPAPYRVARGPLWLVASTFHPAGSLLTAVSSKVQVLVTFLSLPGLAVNAVRTSISPVVATTVAEVNALRVFIAIPFLVLRQKNSFFLEC